MKNLPSLDLSQYENLEALPLKVERIIVQALVFYKMNIGKVSEKYNLSKEKVSEIATEYYTSIIASIDSQTDIKIVNQGLADASAVLSEHIKNIKNSQKDSETKTLNETTLRNVCKIMDRLTGIQSNYSKLSEISTTKLASTINEARTTDAAIEGKPEDTSEYNENVETVYTKLRTVARRIKASNIKTKEVRRYGTLREAGNAFGINPDYIRTKISTRTLYKDEWVFENDED